MLSLVVITSLVAVTTTSPLFPAHLLWNVPTYTGTSPVHEPVFHGSHFYTPLITTPLTSTHNNAYFVRQPATEQYTYGYRAPTSSKTETRQPDGSVTGSYSYLDADNRVQTISYTADERNGFRVSATNLPQPVVDTVEVAAAKKHFQRLYDEAAANSDAASPAVVSAQNERNKDGGMIYEMLQGAPMRQAVLPKPVQDTPEVAAAKRQFKRLYEEAAAAAAAAPDFHRRRRRRHAPLLLLPAAVKTKFHTVSLSRDDQQPTPADTTLLRYQHKEHEAFVPAALLAGPAIVGPLVKPVVPAAEANQDEKEKESTNSSEGPVLLHALPGHPLVHYRPVVKAVSHVQHVQHVPLVHHRPVFYGPVPPFVYHAPVEHREQDDDEEE